MAWVLLACGAAPVASKPSFLTGLDEGPAPYVGEVRERVDAGGYHYVRVAGPDGDRWVVSVLAPPDAVAVSVRPFGHLDSFWSPRAARTFSPLDFATVTVAPEVP